MNDLRYRVTLDGERTAQLSQAFTCTQWVEAVEHLGFEVAKVEVFVQYNLAEDRQQISTNEPRLAALLTALQEGGIEGLDRARALMPP